MAPSNNSRRVGGSSLPWPSALKAPPLVADASFNPTQTSGVASHRCIEPPLRFACSLQGRPSCIPLSKPKGIRAVGLRFEKALHKALSGSIHGQWWEFKDACGYGLCQTDLIYPFHLQPGPATIAVIEVKYTLVPGAHSKLSSLYIPVVQRATNCLVAGIVVVKNLDPRFRRGKIFTSLKPAVDAALDTGYPSLIQWSGQNLLHDQAARSDAPAYSPSLTLSRYDANHSVSQTD